MHSDQGAQGERPLSLCKPDRHPQEITRVSIAEKMKETPSQIALSDGMPAWIGVTSAMVVIGAPFLPAVTVGLLFGLGFTLLRSRTQP